MKMLYTELSMLHSTSRRRDSMCSRANKELIGMRKRKIPLLA